MDFSYAKLVCVFHVNMHMNIIRSFNNEDEITSFLQIIIFLSFKHGNEKLHMYKYFETKTKKKIILADFLLFKFLKHIRNRNYKSINIYLYKCLSILYLSILFQYIVLSFKLNQLER